MNVALYARVSTADQAEKGYSLETQLLEDRTTAKEFGATTFVEFIDDGYSGEYIDRPALSRLREALQKKEFDMVVVYDPDRLARNLAHQLIITDDIERSGARLIFVSVTFENSPEGKLFYSMRGAISAYEKEKIKERTMRGKKGKAKQGKLVSNGRPYGYNYDKKNSTYIINEEQAIIIRQIFDLCAKKKLGTALISKEINAQGIPAPRGKQWIVSSIYRILTNTAYKGVVYSMQYKTTKTGLNTKTRELRPESEWIPITVPAIIDEVIWQAAQKQLKTNKDTAKRNSKYDHLLNGIVYCAKCGRKMMITHSGKSDKPISYYVCLAQISTSYIYSDQEKCAARRVPTSLLDSYVWDKLNELGRKPELIRQYVEKVPDTFVIQRTKTLLQKLKDTESKLSKQRDVIMRWFRQQMISDVEADKQLQDIRNQSIDIESTRKRLSAELDLIALTSKSKDIVANINQYFFRDDYTNDEKRTAIRAVLDKVIVERVDTTFARGSKPELNINLKFC